MALMSYKCPNCGGGLVFDPDSQKFQCEYCLSEFTEEEMKRMEEASAFPAKEEKAVLEEEGTAPQEGDSSQSPETGEAAVYTLSLIHILYPPGAEEQRDPCGPLRPGGKRGGFLFSFL